jgi:thiol-disulfide isomerase/thioredoxin
MSAVRIAIFLTTSVLFTAILSAQGLTNRRAPSFSLPDSSMQQHDILDYRGSWLFLDFMKTDCTVCKQLSIKLENVKKKYGVKVAVLSIVITPPENQATVAKYVAETKSTAPIVFDSPHLFAISPTGMIVKDWGQNGVESPNFLTEVDQLIAGSTAKK